MIFKKNLILVFVGLIFFSCGDHILDKIVKQKKAQEEIRATVIDSLASDYKIVYRWDTIDANYRRHLFTINLNPIINSTYQIIGKFRITDIYKKDSINHISIITGRYGSFYLDFPITESQQDQLTNKNKEFILVVSVREIKKIRFGIQGELADNENEDVEISLDNPESFIGKGSIVKIISIDKLNME